MKTDDKESMAKFCADLEGAALDFDRSNPWEQTGAMLKKAARLIRILDRILGAPGSPPVNGSSTPTEGTGQG